MRVVAGIVCSGFVAWVGLVPLWGVRYVIMGEKWSCVGW